MSTQHTVFITGAAGYVGAMLVEQYAARSDVARIVGLDKEERPEQLASIEKLVWITANTADKDDWHELVLKENPDIVIHAAWQIREMYGNQQEEWRWNVEGSRNIFDFAFKHDGVKRLVHFSTAAVYGAYHDNTFDHHFVENEPMREEVYIYAVEKKQSELDLRATYDAAQKEGTHTPIVSVIRPAAITGPRGRFARIRFGLQAALAGDLRGNVFYRIISLMVSFIPASKKWVRQFVHEDDVVEVVSLLSFDEKVSHSYEVFNMTPPGEPVYQEQMADITGKRILPIYPWMARVAFFFFWHVSRGIIPNGKGVWRFYCYPIVMSGTKLMDMYGFSYEHNSRDAFRYTTGRYEHVVPEARRRPKAAL
jgi:nucleoside-diphosphate-sugar epimerase